MFGMGWWVQGRQLVAEGQFFAMRLDQLGDVITLEWDREAGKWARDRYARGECVVVVVDVDRLLPTGHHGYPVMPFLEYWAAVTQRLEVRVRVSYQPVISKEVQRCQIIASHGVPP
jgi:hypothetical protein